jgi:VIT1/CCC1 family predicted Fe2+/Mn2+ transporter
LGTAHNPKIIIISTLLVLAIADNISDSFGIHIYRESQSLSNKSLINTLSNFLTRLAVTLVFILLILFLPLQYAILSSVIIGLSLLSILSYQIAINQKMNPYLAILQHIGVAAIVIIVSYFLGQMITNMFNI